MSLCSCQCVLFAVPHELPGHKPTHPSVTAKGRAKRTKEGPDQGAGDAIQASRRRCRRRLAAQQPLHAAAASQPLLPSSLSFCLCAAVSPVTVYVLPGPWHGVLWALGRAGAGCGGAGRRGSASSSGAVRAKGGRPRRAACTCWPLVPSGPNLWGRRLSGDGRPAGLQGCRAVRSFAGQRGGSFAPTSCRSCSCQRMIRPRPCKQWCSGVSECFDGHRA